jgi:hypothetical protein
MTGPSSAEDTPVQPGDSLVEHNTDAAKETVDENDRREDFISHDGQAWPDTDPAGGNFELVAFPPPEEGVS